MTMNLYWKPVLNDGEGLSDKLKFALRKKFGAAFNVRLEGSHVEYLEGLRDAGIDDAETLINAIYEHCAIEVYEQ